MDRFSERLMLPRHLKGRKEGKFQVQDGGVWNGFEQLRIRWTNAALPKTSGSLWPQTDLGRRAMWTQSQTNLRFSSGANSQRAAMKRM
jgi:hypothetical protein